ncbi:MAG: hypothetical protein KC416_12755 [Myxococcales bacterium]|nr:hypothetical protein [Myxococcales bacterium]
MVRGAAGLFLILAMSMLASGLRADSKSGDAAKCVDVSKSTPYRNYGYDHVVTLKNGCTKAVSCSVTTNTNPDESKATLSPDETKSITMFRGSPAREFEAKVRCIYP